METAVTHHQQNSVLTSQLYKLSGLLDVLSWGDALALHESFLLASLGPLDPRTVQLLRFPLVDRRENVMERIGRSFGLASTYRTGAPFLLQDPTPARL